MTVSDIKVARLTEAWLVMATEQSLGRVSKAASDEVQAAKVGLTTTEVDRARAAVRFKATGEV